jgi:hypothetical protein
VLFDSTHRTCSLDKSTSALNMAPSEAANCGCRRSSCPAGLQRSSMNRSIADKRSHGTGTWIAVGSP